MTTEDRFLGGRVIVRQPALGFRAGLDAVMLAAAVPAVTGNETLELGIGSGVASLCLARRIDGVVVKGLDIDPALVDLANTNARANAMTDRVAAATADIFALPQAFRRPFDHVFCNPPFHGGEGEAPPHAGRALALHDEGRLASWLAAGLKRTVSGGSFTAIIRADRLSEALGALPERGITIFPLWPRSGEAAKRVILQTYQGSRAPLQMLAGLVLHQPDGTYTPEADAVLRGGAGLAI